MNHKRVMCKLSLKMKLDVAKSTFDFDLITHIFVSKGFTIPVFIPSNGTENALLNKYCLKIKFFQTNF